MSEETKINEAALDSFIEEEGIEKVSQIVYKNSALPPREQKLLVENIAVVLALLKSSTQKSKDVGSKRQEIEEELVVWQQRLKLVEDLHKKQAEVLNGVQDIFNETKTSLALKKEENWLMEAEIQIMEESVREKEEKLNEGKERILKQSMPEHDRLEAEQIKLANDKQRLEPTLAKKEEALKALKKQKEVLFVDREKQEKDIVKLLQDIADRSEAPMRKEKELNMLKDRNQLFMNKIEKHQKKNGELRKQSKAIEANIEKAKLSYEQQVEAFNQQSAAHEKSRVRIAEMKNSLRKLKADQMEVHDLKMNQESQMKRVLCALRDKDQILRKVKCEINSLKNELKNHKNDADRLKFDIMEETKHNERLSRQQEDYKKKIQDLKGQGSQVKFDLTVELKKFENLQGTENAERKLIQSKQKQLADLEDLLKELREIEIEALRNCKDAAELRSIMSRKACATQEDLREIQEELTVKELLILDCNKKNQALEKEMQKFKRLYECVKNERNGYVNSLQLTSQNKAEIQDKFKGLLREIEILKNTLSDKNKTFKSIKNSILFVKRIRDKRKNKFNKMEERRRKMEEHHNSLANEISKLAVMVKMLDEDVLYISKKNDTGCAQRNSFGKELIKANEDLCLFYNACNINKEQQRVLQLKMTFLQKNHKHTITKIASLKATNEILAKKGDELPLMAQQIAKLSEALEQEKSVERSLLEKLQSPEQNTNLRHLTSEDVAPEALARKVESLEQRINDKKDAILQKKILLEDLEKSISDAQAGLNSTRHEDLQKNSNVNRLNKNYEKLLRKVFSLVSELSIFQANCIRLEKDKGRYQELLQTIESNIAGGLPPLSDSELKYLKLIRNEQMEADMAYQRTMETEFAKNIEPFVKKTTAQKRVDSYFNKVGLPQPYGVFKPFMPQKPGANLRHYKNPAPAFEDEKENFKLS